METRDMCLRRIVDSGFLQRIATSWMGSLVLEMPRLPQIQRCHGSQFASPCPHAFAPHRWGCHFVLPGIHRSNLGSYGKQLGPQWSEQVEAAKDSLRTSDLRSRGGKETTTQEKVTRHRRGRCHFSAKNETAKDDDSQVFSSIRSGQPGF